MSRALIAVAHSTESAIASTVVVAPKILPVAAAVTVNRTPGELVEIVAVSEIELDDWLPLQGFGVQVHL